MSTLGTDPSIRTEGHTLTRKAGGIMARTNTNVATIAPEYCAYCKQELIYQIGFGYLPHEQKPLVTNKAGEPYSVVWASRDEARVFHPGDLEYYTVNVSLYGELTCRHRSDFNRHSDQGRCWPWHKANTCPHCDAVQASMDAGERPGRVENRVEWVEDDDLIASLQVA